ncbi:MAG: tellurite resistance TerB family protein [Nitratireductor sp.]
MFDAKQLLDQFIGAAEGVAGKDNVDKVRKGIAENPGMAKAAGIGLAAVLLGTRSGRALTGTAVKLGGLAAVGGLAYKAYQNWQGGGSAQVEAPPVDARESGSSTPAPRGQLLPPPQDTAFSHDEANGQDAARIFLTAMIAAAKSDGQIDADEQKRIFGKLNEMETGAEGKAYLMEEMMAPIDVDRIAAMATTRERAVEIYTASCMAIVTDTDAERQYLDRLAEKMGLEKGLAALVEKAINEERAAA